MRGSVYFLAAMLPLLMSGGDSVDLANSGMTQVIHAGLQVSDRQAAK